MTTIAQIERYQRKARCVVAAWGKLLGASPSLRALARVMAVAEFESRLGDARGWKGEHNWGAIQKRPLSAAERTVLATAGISAAGGEEVLSAARARLPSGANEALHIDSSPTSGRYFAWFWSFSSDEEAARKFLQVLVVQRPAVRAVLDHDDVRELARAMFETGYYEGYHRNDPESNIRDYGLRLAELEPGILSALSAAPARHPCPTCGVDTGPPPRPLENQPSRPSTEPPPVSPAPTRRSTRKVGFIIGALTLLMFTVAGRAAR